MTVRELGHLVLYVRDLGRSAAFYRDVLGLAPGPARARRGPVGAAGVLVGPHPSRAPPDRGRRRRHADPAGRRVGLYHFGLNVGETDDDLRAALAAVQAAGATVVGAADHTVTHSLYILDPDGNEIELYVDVPGVDWQSDPTLVGAAIRPLRL